MRLRPCFALCCENMEIITSRKNKTIAHFKKLGSSRSYRRDCREYVCDGEKLFVEAINAGANIKTVLFSGGVPGDIPDTVQCNQAPAQLLQYASPLENTRGPIFSVEIPEQESIKGVKNAIVLETIQDPGNVGTILRTANALGIELVILCGDCADPYNAKSVRAAMGALFRQKTLELELPQLMQLLRSSDLKLYGTALSDESVDIRSENIKNAAVAIGSEGRGLSPELLGICDKTLVIPMQPNSESLNAAVAAAIVMWQMQK